MEESVSGQLLHGGGTTGQMFEGSWGQPGSRKDVTMNADRLGTLGRDHPRIFKSDAGKTLDY